MPSRILFDRFYYGYIVLLYAKGKRYKLFMTASALLIPSTAAEVMPPA